MDPPTEQLKETVEGSAAPFSPSKYVLRIKARPRTSTIPETEENGSSVTKSSPSSSSSNTSKRNEVVDSSDSEVEQTDSHIRHIRAKNLSSSSSTTSTSMSSSSPSVSQRTASSATTTSRLENGDRVPRLAAGVFYKKPTPILGEHVVVMTSSDGAVAVKHGDPLPHPSTCLSSSSSEMRGPPPAWQPPCPPDSGDRRQSHDYENNYEDPEDLHKAKDASRDLLLAAGPPPTYNSYEMSLSQQRRSNAMTTSSASEEWDEPQRVLHKNSQGTYYIPAGTGSMRTTSSTLSPSSQVRYHDQCPTMSSHSSSGQSRPRQDPSTSSLLKYNTTATITGTHVNKKRSSKMPMMPSSSTPSSEKQKSFDSRRPPPCSLFLGIALLIALVAIILLLCRGPSYVYSSASPSSLTPSSIPFDESLLRPLPSVIGIGQRVEADIVPKHVAVTELFVSRPSRIQLNLTLGSGSQMVLLGRHSVPPSLYLHDFFRPLRTHQPSSPSPSHLVEHRRAKRHMYDIVDPRSAVVEEFLLEGRWHLMLINERNRVEPISLLISIVPAPSTSPSDYPLSSLRCDQDCSGHGECLSGKCRCSHGYTGDACEDPVCPVVCSGNGVFSGGVCVCNTGFKGKECDLRSSWCEVPDCSGHGRCSAVDGVCRCDRGWTGLACQTPDCPHPRCSDHGVCVNGTCFCSQEWTGPDCAMSTISPPTARPLVEVVARPPSPVVERPRQISRETAKDNENAPDAKQSPSSRLPSPTVIPRCSQHGQFQSGACQCDHGWTGDQCQLNSCPDCQNGLCSATSGLCACYPGWQGANCDRPTCPIGCEEHGTCTDEGTCQCNPGWNGLNCYQDGCFNGCSGAGECVSMTSSSSLSASLTGGDSTPSFSVWSCSCQPGRTGSDCSVPMETDCSDGMDNDNDDLIDCDDPECCSSPRCRDHVTCVYSQSPSEVLLRMPSIRNAQFSERVAFLYQNDIQKYADPTKFNDSLVSLVRGRVVWDGGVQSRESDKLPLVGVRVSDGRTPLWGFTLSRLDGEFDLVVNGAQTVQLRFQRNPFLKTVRNIYVPPNEIFYIGDVQMYSEKHPLVSAPSARPQCSVAARQNIPQPVVRASWQLAGTAAAQSNGLQVDSRTVIERIPLPGCSVSLVYDSSRVPSSHSWIVLALLPSNPDPQLRAVHVNIRVAGRTFDEILSPLVNLTHVWSWDKLNVFRQKEHGLVPVHVRIGYEYSGCNRESEIVWTERRVQLEGATARQLEGDAWSLDIHHHLDVVNNVLEMGDGSRRFLSDSAPFVVTVAGDGTKREMDCTACFGVARKASLLRPTTMAYSTLDGSLFIGDHELIRRLDGHGNISTVLQLSTADTSHSYHLAVSPLDGSLFISLSLRKQIWKLTSMEPLDVGNNYEVIAGDGSTCTSHASSCGDGGPATEAQLVLPKGIAFNAQGDLYVADGRRIRVISSPSSSPSSSSLSIRSIGEHSPPERPPPCSQGGNTVGLDDMQLEWPTSLSVHLPTGNLFVLDTNVVYEIDEQQDTATIVLGSLSTCSSNSSSLFSIRSAKDISVAADGAVYVVESDGKHINQIRRFSPDRLSFSLFAGQPSACSCDVTACGCDDSSSTIGSFPLSSAPFARAARFNSPSAVAVTPHGDVFVADSANVKVKRVSRRSASYDPIARLYTVVNPDSNELYAFNRHGLHTWTQSMNTGRVLYNFTYNVDTSLGRLSSIHGAGEMLVRLIRPNETTTVVETPMGERTKMVASIYDGSIERVVAGGKEAIKLHYAPGGLLLSRTQDGLVRAYGYDERGRAVRVRRDAEGFELEHEQLLDGRYSTGVLRNGRLFARFSHRDKESSYRASDYTRLVSMDDGLLVSHGQMTSLLDVQPHPNHGESSIMKSRTTIPSIRNPSRRELTFRFDWRPFVKRGSDRRVAEVGIRPRVNGVNIYTVSFDRAANRDVIRARNTEEELLSIDYTDSGEIRAISQSKEEDGEGADAAYRLASLTNKFDSLGRRISIQWGNVSIQASYDRQNRQVERVSPDGSTVKYTYYKDGRQPSSVALSSDVKYTVKYDSRGRLREVSTPIGEIHSFAAVPTGKETVILRRYPFTKKPFRLLLTSPANGEKGGVTEWTTPDELHQKVQRIDQYGNVRESLCDGLPSSFSFDSSSLLSNSQSGDSLSRNVTWQGHLMSTNTMARKGQDGRWLESSFSYEYDDVLRVTSIHCVIEGTAVEAIQMGYDERSALLAHIGGYQILRETTLTRIQGHKLLHEILLDAYRHPSAVKVVVGDVRISRSIDRDASGRVTAVDWKLPRGTIKETRVFDSLGRAVTVSSGSQRWSIVYNNDGRPTAMNDVTFEWLAGGVPKKTAKQEYTLDANGWVIRRGDAAFELDCEGRVASARTPSYRFEMKYDEMGRLVWLSRGKTEHSIFYALPSHPNLISHFTSSDSGLTTVIRDEDGRPFALIREDGYRYGLVTDEDGSLRFVVSESGVIKEIGRDPLGGIVMDSDPAFWVPIGYRGGIDLPSLSLSIIDSRPLDHFTGRFLSFSPAHSTVISFSPDIASSLDLFSLPTENEMQFPSDLPSWFRLVGLSPSLLPSDRLRLSSRNTVSPVSSRSLSSLHSRLALFSSPLSVSPSALLSRNSASLVPSSDDVTFAVEDPGFSELFMLIPAQNTTLVEALQSISADDHNQLVGLFQGAEELDWRQFGSGLERHFVREAPPTSGLTSESRTHYTIVSSGEKAELRSGKARIVVHFGKQADVMQSLIEDLRRREGPSVWRAEKRRVEREDQTSRQWTETQRRELVSKGAVLGFHLDFSNPLNVRFPSCHQWKFTPN